MAQTTRTVLYVLLGLLMVDSLIEVGFIGSMVGYLHQDHPMKVMGANNVAVILKGKPGHMSVDQGHTSNGAAGTALMTVGLLGVLLLSLRTRLERSIPRLYMPLLTFWSVMAVLSLILTFAALIYTFVITHQSSGQHIDLSGLTSPIRYPRDSWVPQTWYQAILDDLTLVDGTTTTFDGKTYKLASRSEVQMHLNVFNGWKWNLIVMFLLQLAITPLIVLEYLGIRKGERDVRRGGEYKAAARGPSMS